MAPGRRSGCAGDHTHIQDAEACSTGGTGYSAAQPGFRPLLVLATGKPSTHTGHAPHGPAQAALALPVSVQTLWLTHLDQFDVGWDLHTTNTWLQLLSTGQVVRLVESDMGSKSLQEALTDTLVDDHIGRVSDGHMQLVP